MSVGDRHDPYLGCRFLVEIEGLVVAGFSELSGLQSEISSEDYEEGGVNDYVHKLPKAARYPNLTLKRGITDCETLWNWHRQMVQGRASRRTVRVILLDDRGSEKIAWRCLKACPLKWNGPDFRADSATVAIESLELAHCGIERM
jgi:phage tail-like protein